MKAMVKPHEEIMKLHPTEWPIFDDFGMSKYCGKFIQIEECIETRMTARRYYTSGSYAWHHDWLILCGAPDA